MLQVVSFYATVILKNGESTMLCEENKSMMLLLSIVVFGVVFV